MNHFGLVEEQKDRDAVSSIVAGCLYLTNFRGKLKIGKRKHTHKYQLQQQTIPKLSVCIFACEREGASKCERREKERASVRE